MIMDTVHIKAAELRLGNILSTADDPANRSAVLSLEPGLVHLIHRDFADDENVIIGVQVSRELMAQYHIPFNCWHQFGKLRAYIELTPMDEYAFLHAPGIVCRFQWLHQLQNLMLDICDYELITEPVVHHPFKSND